MEKDKFAWEQLCRLGEMLGDGLGDEDPWIGKEYTRIAKTLMPDAFTEQRKMRIVRTNEAVAKRLIDDRCKCGSEMKQSRSGSYVVKCIDCGTRYKYKSKK